MCDRTVRTSTERDGERHLAVQFGDAGCLVYRNFQPVFDCVEVWQTRRKKLGRAIRLALNHDGKPYVCPCGSGNVAVYLEVGPHYMASR